MTASKKELAVAALRCGTVIDHIPSSALFKAVQILDLEHLDSYVTVGNNLESKRLGRKGIIKIADVRLDQDVINRIALIAPTAVINTIEDYEVVDKRPVELPDSIEGIVRCSNPKCVTNNEPMRTRFEVESREPVVIRCHYCNHEVQGDKAQIL